MKQYVCSICGYIYDEEKNGRWEDLPDDWKCPICRAGKDAFRLKEQKTEEKADNSQAAEEWEGFSEED